MKQEKTTHPNFDWLHVADGKFSLGSPSSYERKTTGWNFSALNMFLCAEGSYPIKIVAWFILFSPFVWLFQRISEYLSRPFGCHAWLRHIGRSVSFLFLSLTIGELKECTRVKVDAHAECVGFYSLMCIRLSPIPQRHRRSNMSTFFIVPIQ